ncbi:MAG: hypothetical protein KAU60_00735 [Desulfobacterales bacterium]|nr:hypothetical protein [Desulfobacterales bacterium]
MNREPLNPYIIFLIVVSFFIGVAGGVAVARTRAIDFLSLLIKLPIILYRFPGSLRDKMKVWRELRLKRRIAKKSRQRQIKTINDKIRDWRKQIRQAKAEIRRVK